MNYMDVYIYVCGGGGVRQRTYSTFFGVHATRRCKGNTPYEEEEDYL